MSHDRNNSYKTGQMSFWYSDAKLPILHLIVTQILIKNAMTSTTVPRLNTRSEQSAVNSEQHQGLFSEGDHVSVFSHSLYHHTNITGILLKIWVCSRFLLRITCSYGGRSRISSKQLEAINTMHWKWDSNHISFIFWLKEIGKEAEKKKS